MEELTEFGKVMEKSSQSHIVDKKDSGEIQYLGNEKVKTGLTIRVKKFAKKET